jgi:Na+-transporting methylmalonyl-CoA/oxaloacetate decarboxylase gamma subunit
MTDKQLGVLYTIVLTLLLTVILGMSHLLDKSMSAEDHADKLCQELYGPQVGHKWVDATLMCETVRGEVLAIRNTN